MDPTISGVLLAMSGGVDSSTAGVLLRREGRRVVGCTMQLWDYRRNPSVDGRPQYGKCCSLDDVYDARRVAEHLGFPFYVLNLEKQFERRVIEPFIGNYLEGKTPIPCTLCNTFLKFDRLLQFADGIGLDQVATGHYARIGRDENGSRVLLRGRDEAKDQSYYLFELTQRQLARIHFPVGGYDKETIREIAESNGLVTARKQESQEICFVPDRDYAGFIRRHAGEVNPKLDSLLRKRERPGPILFKDGTRLGEHSGIHHFTVGQRKGLKVAHPRPLYVLRVDPVRNAVVVGYREDLFSSGLVAERVNWISEEPPGEEVEVQVRIRSRHRPARARVRFRGSASKPSVGSRRALVEFEEPQMSVTPGQAAVFYQGERVLGGGWIVDRL